MHAVGDAGEPYGCVRDVYVTDHIQLHVCVKERETETKVAFARSSSTHTHTHYTYTHFYKV